MVFFRRISVVVTINVLFSRYQMSKASVASSSHFLDVANYMLKIASFLMYLTVKNENNYRLLDVSRLE